MRVCCVHGDSGGSVQKMFCLPLHCVHCTIQVTGLKTNNRRFDRIIDQLKLSSTSRPPVGIVGTLTVEIICSVSPTHLSPTYHVQIHCYILTSSRECHGVRLVDLHVPVSGHVHECTYLGRVLV